MKKLLLINPMDRNGSIIREKGPNPSNCSWWQTSLTSDGHLEVMGWSWLWAYEIHDILPFELIFSILYVNFLTEASSSVEEGQKCFWEIKRSGLLQPAEII